MTRPTVSLCLPLCFRALLLPVSLGCFYAAAGEDLLLYNFRAQGLPDHAVAHDATATPLEGKGLQVEFRVADWPQVYFKAPPEGWNWSAYAGMTVTLFNPGVAPVDVSVRVDNAPGTSAEHWVTLPGTVESATRQTLDLQFEGSAREVFWGMRGVPGIGPVGQGPILDPAAIAAFQIFLPRPREAHTLIIEEVRLYGDGHAPDIALPFVDAYGQYKHEDWPGKLHEEEELALRARQEAERLQSAPALPGRDAYGGWADGPKLEATGWFRTEKVEDKWWLVTPEGHLFFSTGMDCVGTWAQTFVTGRDTWFDWLPEAEDPIFGRFYGHASKVHSMAEKIGASGRTFGFYSANLRRKYGEDWAKAWRENAYARLQAWGFNTVGNWSQGDVIQGGPIPFVVSNVIDGVPRIEGATGYWAKMFDVYDPAFEAAADKAVTGLAASYAGNPKCIGYFIDNELAWEGVTTGALRSPDGQPCRKALIQQLQEKHVTLDALNAAWGTEFMAWEDLHEPGAYSAEAREDLEVFLHAFARRYFETIDAAVQRHAPNQLYLGCRFATAPPPAVQACAEVADIVSFNMYYRWVPCEKWSGKKALGKPILIGEFHFGAMDRGMFHPGLVKTANQQERAGAYARYVQSVADCPEFVGCHWFQYVDEAITGRPYDGENYNIGFLDVTDTPYPELVQAAQVVHTELYQRRYYGEAGTAKLRPPHEPVDMGPDSGPAK